MRQKLRRAAPVGGDLLRLLFECFDEQPTDDLALGLRVFDAFKRGEKQILRLHMMQRNIVVIAKETHHFFRFALTQHAVIDENTSQRVANRFMNEHRGDGEIDAAGQSAQDTPTADLMTNGGNRFLTECSHCPIGFQSRDLMHEVRDELRAVGRVHDFEMKLHAVIAARFVGDRRQRRILGRGDDAKAFRQTRHAIAVTHPYRIFGALLPHARKERALLRDLDFRASEFAVMTAFDPAAQLFREKLFAITNGKNGDFRVEDRLGSARRSLLRYGARTAGENDRLRSNFRKGFLGALKRRNFAIDAGFANAPRNQLRHL